MNVANIFLIRISSPIVLYGRYPRYEDRLLSVYNRGKHRKNEAFLNYPSIALTSCEDNLNIKPTYSTLPILLI
jgi:hypothetical protein